MKSCCSGRPFVSSTSTCISKAKVNCGRQNRKPEKEITAALLLVICYYWRTCTVFVVMILSRTVLLLQYWAAHNDPRQPIDTWRFVDFILINMIIRSRGKPEMTDWCTSDVILVWLPQLFSFLLLNFERSLLSSSYSPVNVNLKNFLQ